MFVNNIILVLVSKRLKLIYKYLLLRIANCRIKARSLNKLNINCTNIARKAHLIATINIKINKLKNY